MKKEYTVIKPTEDGTQIYQMDKNSLRDFIKRLPDGWDFVTDIESVGSDPNYWGYNILIIKGKTVVPNPVEVAIEYEIE